MLFLLLVVSFLTVGVGGSCWVLLDWLRERRTLREQKTRARLGRILHRRDQGQPCRRRAPRCVRRRRLWVVCGKLNLVRLYSSALSLVPRCDPALPGLPDIILSVVPNHPFGGCCFRGSNAIIYSVVL